MITPPKSNIPTYNFGGISGINAPAFGSDLAPIAGAEKSAVVNFPAEVKQKIGQEVQTTKTNEADRIKGIIGG